MRIKTSIKWDDLFDGAEFVGEMNNEGDPVSPISKKFEAKKKDLNSIKKNTGKETMTIKGDFVRMRTYLSGVIQGSRRVLTLESGMTNSKVDGFGSTSSGFGDFVEGVDIDLELAGKESLYDFMGMKLNGDMDVIIEGGAFNVRLLNLATSFHIFLNGTIRNMSMGGQDSSDMEAVVRKLNEGVIRDIMEKLKFGDFTMNDLASDDFYALDEGSTADYESTTISFLKSEGISGEGLGEEDIKNAFKRAFSAFISYVLEEYGRMKVAVGWLEELNEYIGAIVGESRVREVYEAGCEDPIDGPQALRVTGNLKGFRDGGSYIEGLVNTSLWKGVMEEAGKGYVDSTVNEVMLMDGMTSGVEGSEWVDDMGVMRALSMMDYIKYRDDDISLAGLDVNEDRDFILENVEIICSQVDRGIFTPEVVEAVGKMLVGTDGDELGELEIPGMEGMDISELKPDTELPDDAPEFVILMRGFLRGGRIAKNLMDRMKEI